LFAADQTGPPSSGRRNRGSSVRRRLDEYAYSNVRSKQRALETLRPSRPNWPNYATAGPMSARQTMFGTIGACSPAVQRGLAWLAPLAAAGPKIVYRQIRSIRVLSPTRSLTIGRLLSAVIHDADWTAQRLLPVLCASSSNNLESPAASFLPGPRRHARMGCTQTNGYLNYLSTYVKR